jgi:hypothetical protein
VLGHTATYAVQFGAMHDQIGKSFGYPVNIPTRFHFAQATKLRYITIFKSYSNVDYNVE